MKTQTRRVIRPQTDDSGLWNRIDSKGYSVNLLSMPGIEALCPFGQPGERLWVRETFAITGTGKTDCVYAADGIDAHEYTGPLKPSIHMPLWASRITLENTNVRAERLQKISDFDAMSEGCEGYRDLCADPFNDIEPREEYRDLWNSLNADRGFGWDVNPRVWVIEFKRVFDVKAVKMRPILFSTPMVRAILGVA